MKDRSFNDDCGLNGVDCGPFSNATTVYLCDPDCGSEEVWEPRVVGDQEIQYRSLVIGGALDAISESIYRADSSICQAAVHAGVIENDKGGIAVMRLVGNRTVFPATLSNGIQSIGFDADFPKSFVFVPVDGGHNGAWVLRWTMLTISVLVTSSLSVFLTSPSAFFATVFTMLFLHVALVSDKPEMMTTAGLVSVFAGRFLPAAFVAAVIYKSCVHPQLNGLSAPFERTVLWLGGAWFGALENYTLDHLPIRRLTPHDLQSQAGAIGALVAVIAIVIAIAIGQIHYLRLECRLRRYLKLYACMAGGLAVLAVVPSLHLRLHHYIIALLLLPGTAIQTRPSLFYQGLLIGLFINGVARWGFASILQTDEDLRGKDGRYGSPVPNVTASTLLNATAIAFEWEQPPWPYDGVSVLVNDVERHRSYIGQGGLDYTWSRGAGSGMKSYFRFAYRTEGHAVDYTSAGIWEADGRWTPFEHE